MCGIAGFWTASSLLDPEAVLRRMGDAIRHRGPDAGAVRFFPQSGVGLAHRRLAIVDLSPAGVQPMSSPSGRYTIVFNGEVYNFERLRIELGTGPAYRGHSDTEVMLRAFDAWGIEHAVPRFLGMFAFAVWDQHEQRLVLCRDRLGKKPLYFGNMGGTLVFGSELKALQAFPGFSPAVDRDSLASYLRHNYIPAPFSIFQGIGKLEPGHMVGFHRSKDGSLLSERSLPYWSAEDEFMKATGQPFAGTFEDAKCKLDLLLRDAVALRMISDVPLGAFLSGGIDSTLVVALMQAQSRVPVRTYTIGFEEAAYNEAAFAKLVAKHLSTNHTELYVSPADALAIIPRLPEIFDEPFADSSQLPTYLVSKMTRRHVTVALSGDGGDEGFLGYNRYLWWRKIWRYIEHIPRPCASLASRLVSSIPVNFLNGAGRLMSQVLPGNIGSQEFGRRLHKVAELAGSGSPAQIYRKLVSHWERPEDLLIQGRERSVSSLAAWETRDMDAYTQHMGLLDAVSYLPDDILVKVDRASMAVSLETRAPLLDHRVLEFAWSLPLNFKIRGTHGKYILRELLSNYVPRELFDRPKTGFGVPIEEWLRGPLRDWAEALLDPARLKREGYFHVEPIRAAWQEHVSGRAARHYHLWDILMFQAWLEYQKQGASVTRW